MLRPAALEHERTGAPMAEMQRVAIEQLAQATNAHDAEKVVARYAPNATLSTAPGDGTVTGREAIAKVQKVSFDAFSNFKTAPRRAFFAGDYAIVEWVTTGTHDGEFLGLPPTGRPTGFSSVSVYEFGKDGLIARERVYTDEATLAAQLSGHAEGVAPIPELPTKLEIHKAQGSAAEQQSVAWGRAMYDAWEAGDREKLAAMLADDFKMDIVMAPGPPADKHQLMKTAAKMKAAIPDQRYSITNSWGVENYAIFEYALEGSQRIGAGDAAESSRPIAWHWVEIYELKDGKAVRGWAYANMLELLSQLGAME